MPLTGGTTAEQLGGEVRGFRGPVEASPLPGADAAEVVADGRGRAPVDEDRVGAEVVAVERGAAVAVDLVVIGPQGPPAAGARAEGPERLGVQREVERREWGGEAAAESGGIRGLDGGLEAEGARHWAGGAAAVSRGGMQEGGIDGVGGGDVRVVGRGWGGQGLVELALLLVAQHPHSLHCRNQHLGLCSYHKRPQGTIRRATV